MDRSAGNVDSRTGTAPQGDVAAKGSQGRFSASSSVWSHLMGRTERGLRMALGGGLIMALTMCDIPHMNYSFKYIGPFLFFVVGTLAPPFVSSAAVVLFAGLFCILLACAGVSLLLTCLLVESGGQALCVCVYSILVVWSSSLSVSRTKEMTLIGSYVLLYIIPLATLLAAPYVRSGISIQVTPERYSALREFVNKSSIEEIKGEASHFFLLPIETVEAFFVSITSPKTINMLIKLVLAKLNVKFPVSLRDNYSLDQKKVLQLFLWLATKVPSGKHVSMETKVSKDWGLNLSQAWMYDVPVFVEGVAGQNMVFGARPGAWLIKAVWVASGSIGILRNLIIFGFLGFAVYLLVMFVPPIRRQRDVAVRKMVSACGVLRESVGIFRQQVERMAGEADAPKPEGGAEGQGDESTSGQQTGPAPHSKVDLSCPPAIDALDRTVRRLLDSEKAVLLSGMEPFLFYPGPGVWTTKELEGVRKRLIQCCIQTQRMAHLLRSSKAGSELGGSGVSRGFLPGPASALLAKTEEMYELCEQLLTTFPYVFAPTRCRKRTDELSERMARVEEDMRALGSRIFQSVKVDSEEALEDMESATAASAAPQADEADETTAEASVNEKALRHMADQLPKSLATTAFVHAGYSFPVLLSRSVAALSEAQQVNTWKGFLMNIAFPFVPFFIHLRRLFVTPLSWLIFWRLRWRGSQAWWENPESWYAIKLIVGLMCIFTCGIYLPGFRTYSWGIPSTDRPILLDFTDAGVTTRMVPWFLLGYLTVLQTTYNGTMHRALCRTMGILLGSFFGWLGLKWWGSNITGLIIFCAVTVFLDIFIFADRDHPLDGFHKQWGYAGIVFTYTQSLVVTLATDDLGGLAGDTNYLVATRILSNLMGILLAVVVSHLPPLASATTFACSEYAQVMQCCTGGVSDLIGSFLFICGGTKDDQCVTSIGEDKSCTASSPVRRERERVSAVIGMLDSECKDHLSSAGRFLKEGQHIFLLRPWHTSLRLSKIQVAIESVVLETHDAAQLVADICDDDSAAQSGLSKAVTGPFSHPKSLQMPPEDPLGADCALAKRMSMPLMQRNNCIAIREVLETPEGGEFREALKNMTDAIGTLAAAASAEMRIHLPAFGEKLMSFKGGYARQSDSPADPQQAYETCRASVEKIAIQVKTALAECLGRHHSTHREAQAARIASAFVVMRLLYHLQSISFNLDEIHAVLHEEARSGAPCCQLISLRHISRRK
ncbi:hypothetical protein Esti_004057 [Eimeria stiedai]